MLICFILCIGACGENFLKLASEMGNYSTQQFRDIEQIRKEADRCDYEKECFKKEVENVIKEFCKLEEYDKRGFISERECERQYPYIFLKLFEKGKWASVEGLQAEDEMKVAAREYDEDLADYKQAKRDYDRAWKDWQDGQDYDNDQDYKEAREDWEDAEEDWEEAKEDYEDAWEKYEKARKAYKNFGL